MTYGMIWNLSPEFCRVHKGAEISDQENWSQMHVFLNFKRIFLLYANHISVNLTFKNNDL